MDEKCKVVFNLVFPDYVNTLKIGEYTFTRVKNYEERLLSMFHLGEIWAEFHIIPNTGSHAHTSDVVFPYPESLSHLAWNDEDTTALNDILLLLSLFTKRNVFSLEKDWNMNKDGVLIADSRQWFWGLPASIHFYGEKDDEDSYTIKSGFEKTLNATYELISSSQWLSTYRNGYFLFLARQAFKLRTIDAAFIHCWTIWEHLFSVFNQSWLSDDRIRNLKAEEKISFILVRFGLVDEVTNPDRQKISDDLVQVRNRLIHYGQFPVPKGKNQGNTYLNHAKVFIRLTETIVAKTLDLQPSNVFNTEENLKKFFDGTLFEEEHVG